MSEGMPEVSSTYPLSMRVIVLVTVSTLNPKPHTRLGMSKEIASAASVTAEAFAEPWFCFSKQLGATGQSLTPRCCRNFLCQN